ncbi:autotransporter outer membrane beta-barrel domain-containing protein [Bartonella gliris]|uniref:autotransporter outer membrane beta-barrel domain-containing protein n=1 Tax=Bartonella gliris TaxID=3004109 RepID=UPI003872AA25
MYKKSLLSCTAAIAVMLFSTHFNAYAEVLKATAGDNKTASSGNSYDALEATGGGKINGENIKITSSDPEKISTTGVLSKDSGSEIKLTGTTTIEKVKDGLQAENGGKIVNENLTIKGTNIGVIAKDSNSKIELNGKTTIEKVKNGLEAKLSGTITSKDLKITALESEEPTTGIMASDHGKIKLNGKTTIKNATSNGLMVTNGSTVVSQELTLIGSETKGMKVGIGTYMPDSKIELNGKTTIEKVKNGLEAKLSGTITSKDLKITALESEEPTTGIMASDHGKIKLNGTTTIEKFSNGLAANNGTIEMIDGSITASQTGATFSNKSDKNTLESVTISSGNDGALMDKGISADKNSNVTLTKVTVTQATTGIFANDGSVITVSGGSFDGKTDGVYAKQGSTITLKDNAKVTSSDGYGLHAEGSQSKITKEEGTVSGKKAALFAENGGQIDVTNITLTTTDSTGTGAKADGANSIIELKGKTTIKDSLIGLEANGGTIKMTEGSITASQTGATFSNNSDKNTLENVTISSGKNDALMDKGISADKNSNVTLTNVTVTQATTGIFANDGSTITVSGGSFDGKTDGVYAKQGSTITLKDDAKVTSSDGYGLHAEGSKSKITKEKGTVNGKKAALFAEKGGQIDVTDVALTTTDGTGTGAKAEGADSVIELKGKTTIKDSLIGLEANGGTIKMTEGSITASQTGATFSNNSDKNTLENVTISSGKNDALMDKGISAEKSNVTLTNVTVTQANNGIVANDGSTITVSGGSFDGKTDGVYAKQGSTITLKDDAKVTSSDGYGLHAEGSQSKITKEKGTVNGKKAALFAEKGGQIDVTDVALTTTDGTGTGAKAEGADSVIELKGKTTIKDSLIGLEANGGTIKMTEGSITASQTGATFSNNSDKNTLENVTISSGNDGALMDKGISADKNSNVTLTNVTVTQANNGIVANDGSTITVSGGSFDGKTDGVYAKQGSTITLKDDAKVTSSDGYGLHAEGSQSKITKEKGTVNGKEAALFAEKGGQIDVTDVTLTTDNKGDAASAQGTDSIIKLHGTTTINNSLNGIGAVDGGKIISENLTIIGAEAIDKGPNKYRSGVWTAGSGSEIKLTGKTTIQNVDEGLYADGGSKIISGGDLTIIGGEAIDKGSNEERTGLWTAGSGSEIKLTGKTTIQNVDEGLYADGGSKIISEGDLTITGGENKKITVGVNVAEPDSIIELNGKTTIQNFDVGLSAANNSTIKMINGDIETTQRAVENKIEAKKVALFVGANGHIDLTNVAVTAENNGLQFLGFPEIKPDNSRDPQKHQSNINLTNADIQVENGTGILIGAFVEKSIEDAAAPSIGTVNLKKSKVHADVLLGDGIFGDKTLWKDKDFWDGKKVKVISNGTFTLNADQSTLEGRANIAKDRNVHFDLKNDTKWTLKISKNEKDDDGNLLDIAQRSRSDISTLNLDNSSIIFDNPTEEQHHQTLHIGSGKPNTKAVYNATGDAKIYFNAEWSDGAAIADQKTDRLLINGDVSGTTAVYVTGRLEENNVKINTSAASNVRGLSLIQVSGKAQEDSFKLVNGYTTRDGLPDMYTLRAYGPESSHGKADIAQNLLEEKNADFWDFRLQPEILETSSGQGVNALVPQTASYLVMPNALFYTGLTDMAKQNALLANMRTSVLGREEEKQTGFFLYTYGSTGTLSSERGPLKYGYGADIRYAALQGGITLAAIEGQSVTTHLGLLGTYGKLSFTPKDMANASKSTLDKWSLTAYGTLQHNNGLYLDTLLSYGVLKGNITNALIGKTAKLNDAKMLSISTTVGKEFATGVEGLTFEPQAQVAYQHLMFNTITDADNFTIDMNNPSQWLIRVGGRLTKTVSTENNGPMSFYGKVNLIKTFGDDGTIHIGRDFDLDPMGPAIEGGVGINAQLSHNFSLHGDVSYQQKLQKTGISGASFSGGIRYQF